MYAATKSGVAAHHTSICNPGDWRTLSWSTTATGIPSGSTRQKRSPYARIVSATTWPTVRSPGGSGGGSSRVRTVDLLDQRGQRCGQRVFRLVEAPLAAVRLADRVREHAHLDGGNACESSGTQHRVALHRLDFAAGALRRHRAANPSSCPDRLNARVRQRAAHRIDQP